MSKARRTLLIFLLITIQSLVAAFAGSAVLVGISREDVPSGIYVGDLSIGGMSYSKAAKRIEAEYAEKFENGSVELSIEGAGKFEIPYADIGARVDGNATLEQLKSIRNIEDISDFVNMHFGYSDVKLKPVVKFNESKLRMSLLKLSEEIYVEPVNAEIHYSNGAIVKKADTPGVSLNISKAAEIIRKHLLNDPREAIPLAKADNYLLQAVPASVTMKDYDDINQVHGEYSTKIANKELSDSIRFAAEAINGVILPASGEGGESREFSFIECLKSRDVNFENDNEGFDQVASTLYAALLKAGIPVDSITRWPHNLPVEYIEPGLDAWISGNAGDLKFSNPYGHKIAILAEIDNNSVTVAIAGNRLDKTQNYDISTEVVQKFAPPVYYVENNSLKPGEKIVLDPGKEGLLVNVYRNGELISRDKYDAEKSIIQIAPGTDWKNGGK